MKQLVSSILIEFGCALSLKIILNFLRWVLFKIKVVKFVGHLIYNVRSLFKNRKSKKTA